MLSSLRFATILLILATDILSTPFTAAAQSESRPPSKRPSLVNVSSNLPGGRLELALGYSYHASSLTFGEDGRPTASDPTYSWSVQEVKISGGYGITPRLQLEFGIPFLYPSLTNELQSEDIHNVRFLPGDTSLALRWRVKEKRRPYREFSLLGLSVVPTGYPLTQPGSGLATGTAIPELGAGFSIRQQLGPAALGLVVGHRFRLSRVVPYSASVYQQGMGRLDPGDLTEARLQLQLEAPGRVLLTADIHAMHQGAYALGATDSQFFPSSSLTEVEDSDGRFADAGLEFSLPLRPTLRVSFFARSMFLGKSLDEFAVLGLEAFSPSPGLRGGAAVSTRF